MTSVTTVACASCGAQTPAGKKFCINCGSLARARSLQTAVAA